ncbi:DNA-directed DNA polymerase II small subunit [Halobacterium noricense]|uniref:DNA-directed DNA polymerase II small subunit n=1 Tax=Halobacterium noricense TaxID=223182 RepID=UPI001E4743FA|nr:DNA-directed DNA polymerase II small subunit [Halobacterium noricense]UHH25337.1 DNA-directed DNA polymerase II small subunit [Halobacterium noricense]
MPREPPVRVVRELTSRGYNAEREAVTLLAGASDPAAAVERAVDAAPDDALTLTTAHVREVLDDATPSASATEADVSSGDTAAAETTAAETTTTETTTTETTTTETTTTETTTAAAATPPADPEPEASTDRTTSPTTSTGAEDDDIRTQERTSPVETKGVGKGQNAAGRRDGRDARDDSERSVEIDGDITGESTGTGEYADFVATFRDRYDRLSKKLRGRVNHRPTDALDSMPGGSEAAVVGMVNDIRSTASGHWLVEVEDTNGVFPTLVMKDRDIAVHVDELLMDEVVAVEGTISDDGGILFADDLHFPDIPRTHRPSTADRHVQAALVSDVHVGSQEFAADAWQAFADWLHTEEADPVEYLLIAGDMVEGVGVYPNQDEELDIVDIYDQYETFAEHLKDVPGDMEIVMIPGNHDAVRLAEPQPAFDEELRDIMSAHDARFTGNPSTVTVEGVDILMYHGVSIDEIIAEYPGDDISYDNPHRAMEQLLKKRHVAPQFGGRTRVAPEKEDYLVIDDAPDVFHTGHVHKLGVGGYHNVRLVNSGCWQHQTEFQKSVNIDPDVATAPILDLDTLDVTVRKFV